MKKSYLAVGFMVAAVAAATVGCKCEKVCGDACETACAKTCATKCGECAPAAKHVVLIGVDGCGARWIPWDVMPNLKALRDEGLYTVGRCHRPTASAINWKSVFSGVSPEIHGFTKWNSAKPDIEPPFCAVDAQGRMPCIFSEVRRQAPGAYTASLFAWDGVGNCHNTNTVDFVRWYGGKKEEYPLRDASVFAEGARQLANNPTLMLLYQGGVDSAGHTYGWGSPEFTNACVNVDANLGKFMTALKASPMWKDTAVLFVADHGGLGKSHGGVEDIRVLEIPFIVSGPAAKGLRLGEPMMLEDVSPTIAALLGLDIPSAWRGRSAACR
jgi:hypothetical protein